MEPFWYRLSVSDYKNVLLLLVQRGHLSPWKFTDMLLRKKGEVGESFLHLLFFKCLQLKIISRPKWHILELHVLNPVHLFALLIIALPSKTSYALRSH